LSTVGVLGDVARNVEEDLYPYCDGIMGLLITNLGSHEVHRSIKPQILSAFGDLALVLGDKYEKYLSNVKQLLQQAMQLSMAQASSRDEDFMDYNNELRIGILEAYSGIFQGLGPGEARRREGGGGGGQEDRARGQVRGQGGEVGRGPGAARKAALVASFDGGIHAAADLAVGRLGDVRGREFDCQPMWGGACMSMPPGDCHLLVMWAHITCKRSPSSACSYAAVGSGTHTCSSLC
jgi:hypothetical protein